MTWPNTKRQPEADFWTGENSLDRVQAIHSEMVAHFDALGCPISPAGVRDGAALASAAGRPFATVCGVELYGTPWLKAGALMHALANNHPLFNGNKRLALLAVLCWLQVQGWELSGCADDELLEFVCNVASHRLRVAREDEVDAMASWLSDKARAANGQPLPAQSLRQIAQQLMEQRHSVLQRLAAM